MLIIVSLLTSLISLILSKTAVVSRKKIVRTVAIRQITIALIYRLLFYYGPSVISVTVTEGGYLRSSKLYKTSRTIGQRVS